VRFLGDGLRSYFLLLLLERVCPFADYADFIGGQSAKPSDCFLAAVDLDGTSIWALDGFEFFDGFGDEVGSLLGIFFFIE